MRKAAKRAAGEARQAQNLRESIASGLAAQRGDQARRRQEQEDALRRRKEREARNATTIKE